MSHSQPKMRIGLIGAGAIAQTWCQALAKSETAQPVGVADVRPEAAQALAERLACSAFPSYESLAAETGCEAVIVCTPPTTHPEICCPLLERGVHVLCEKPLAVGPDEARTMVAAAERSGAMLTMASKFRYAADVVEAKSIVASGVIGDVILFENAFTSRVDMTHRWNSDPLVSGGGVLIDNGTHSVDIMRYFLGPIAEIQVVEGKRIQDIPVEDTVRVFIRSAAGVMGTIDLSWSLNKELANYLSVYGSGGTLHVGWKESKFRRSSDGDWTVFGHGYDKVQAFSSQLDNFVRAARGHEPSRITLQDALASVEVIDAAYDAMWRDSWARVGSELSQSVAAGAA
jgi:predicted dehydrogenase